MVRGRRRARRLRKALPAAPLPLKSIHDPAVAAQQPNAMVNVDGDVFYPDNPEDAQWFAAEHDARPYPRQLTTEELTGGKDDTQLTAELAAALRKIPTCNHCGGRHSRACPRVRRMEFHPNGALASVEFWAEGKWNDSEIIWQEDLVDED